MLPAFVLRLNARDSLTGQLRYPNPGRICGSVKQTEREFVPLLGQARKVQECRCSRDEEGIQFGSETLRIRVGGKPPLAQRFRSE
jgi:hypothetical protein